MARIMRKTAFQRKGNRQSVGTRTKFDHRKISTDSAYLEATRAWTDAITRTDQHSMGCPNLPKEDRPECAVCMVLWKDEREAMRAWRAFGHPLPVGGI